MEVLSVARPASLRYDSMECPLSTHCELSDGVRGAERDWRCRLDIYTATSNSK